MSRNSGSPVGGPGSSAKESLERDDMISVASVDLASVDRPGTPRARSVVLAKSNARTSSIMVWECTAGRFSWHYGEDEPVVVISGEVFITAEKGDETRLGQGDVGFFPAGSSCIWRINDRVKKVAVLRKDMPLALGFGVRVWNKALRIARLRCRSSLMPAVGYRSEPNSI
jgi:uncharacterized protein